jgi:hypothetical protein
MSDKSNVQIVFERGQCKKLEIDGVDIKQCFLAELIMAVKDPPVLRLSLYAMDIDLQIDGAEVEITEQPRE